MKYSNPKTEYVSVHMNQHLLQDTSTGAGNVNFDGGGQGDFVGD